MDNSPNSPVGIGSATAADPEPGPVFPAGRGLEPPVAADGTGGSRTPPPAVIDAGRTYPAGFRGAGPEPPADTPTTGPTVRPKLVVIRGVRAGQEYPVYDGRATIGRFADSPVDIDLTAQEADGQVWSSRRHAAVTFDQGLVLVEDLNSLNGTWVNGTRVYPGSQRLLRPGDVVQVGTVQLRLVV